MWQDFDISLLEGNKLIVNCRTEKLASEFIELMYQNGITWYSGGMKTHFEEYGAETCYWIEDNEITYGDISHVRREYSEDTEYIMCVFNGLDTISTAEFEPVDDSRICELIGLNM